MAVIDNIILNGGQMIIPKELQQQMIEQLHSNHMRVKKVRLLGWESTYLIDINTDIETHIKTVQHVLNFSRHSLRRG